MNLIYLASPYMHEKPAIRWARAQESAFVAAKLMIQLDCAVYAPVASGDAVHLHIKEELRHDHEFWLARDLAILSRCDAIALLPLSGWRESKGVQRELAFSKAHVLPLYLLQDFKGKYLHPEKAELERLSAERIILIES